MRYIASLCFVLISLVAQNVTAESACPKCEVIREANKHLVNEFEYYEDYLKAHPEAAQPKQQQEETEQKASEV